MFHSYVNVYQRVNEDSISPIYKMEHDGTKIKSLPNHFKQRPLNFWELSFIRHARFCNPGLPLQISLVTHGYTTTKLIKLINKSAEFQA